MRSSNLGQESSSSDNNTKQDLQDHRHFLCNTFISWTGWRISIGLGSVSESVSTYSNCLLLISFRCWVAITTKATKGSEPQCLSNLPPYPSYALFLLLISAQLQQTFSFYPVTVTVWCLSILAFVFLRSMCRLWSLVRVLLLLPAKIKLHKTSWVCACEALRVVIARRPSWGPWCLRSSAHEWGSCRDCQCDRPQISRCKRTVQCFTKLIRLSAWWTQCPPKTVNSRHFDTSYHVHTATIWLDVLSQSWWKVEGLFAVETGLLKTFRLYIYILCCCYAITRSSRTERRSMVWKIQWSKRMLFCTGLQEQPNITRQEANVI